MSKTVVIYSGGLDSTVLLTKCKKEFNEVVALNFNYGSKHNEKEREAAKKVCGTLRVHLYMYDLPDTCVCQTVEGYEWINLSLLKSNLLKSGDVIPEGHYEDQTMKKTVVPYRNSIMLSITAGFAESRGIQNIAIANHKGDRAIYPDCRIEYIEAFSEGIRLGGYEGITILSPFVGMTKTEIVKLGLKINAPMGLSWSCYKGEEKHCGLCGTCVERREAFQLAGIEDPTDYE